MLQSCNLNPFSKLLSHFSLFDSQFFAAPFAIHDCCLSCRRLSRTPERANQYPSEVVLDGAWLRRLASNCFVANIPKCISIRSRSGCAKTAGTNADYVSKLRAIKMV